MPETLYTVVNVLVLPPWLLLIAAPRWKWTLPVTAVVYPCLLGAAYLTLLAFNLRSIADGFSSLDNLARLFENPYLLLMGWVHYLAFDLFVGSWQLRDARRSNIPHVLLIPCLLLTLLLGPTGLVCYFALRWRVAATWARVRSGGPIAPGFRRLPSRSRTTPCATFLHFLARRWQYRSAGGHGGHPPCTRT
jgi:ABA DEFICIENT 4-like